MSGRPIGQPEQGRRQHIAGIEEDEVVGKLVDQVAAGMDGQHLQHGGHPEYGPSRRTQAMQQLGHRADHCQHVDEPEHAIGLDHRQADLLDRAARIGGQQADLEDDVDQRPQHIEIEIVHDAAVGECPPGTVDDL